MSADARQGQVFTSAPIGSVIMGVRNDAGGDPGSGGTGNVIALQTDASGNLRVTGGTSAALDGSNNTQVVGNVANGVADSGNPVKVGGKANSSAPTGVTAGQRVDAWYGLFGNQIVTTTGAGAVADGQSTAGGGLSTAGAAHLFANAGFLFNGATWDRARTPNVFKTIAAVAVTAGTPAAAWTPTSGKKFRLMGYALSLSVAGSVIFKDAAAEIARTPLMAAGVGQSSPPMGNGILSALANNVLNIDVSATGSVSGFVFGTEE